MKSLFSRSGAIIKIPFGSCVRWRAGWVRLRWVRGCFFPGCSAPAGRSLKEKHCNERKGTSKLGPCQRGPQSDHLQIRQQALIKIVSSPSIPSTPNPSPSSTLPRARWGVGGWGVGMSVHGCPSAVTSCEPGRGQTKVQVSVGAISATRHIFSRLASVSGFVYFIPLVKGGLVSSPVPQMKHATPGNSWRLSLSCLSCLSFFAMAAFEPRPEI